MTLSSIVTQGEGTKGMSIHIDLTESDWQYLNTWLKGNDNIWKTIPRENNNLCTSREWHYLEKGNLMHNGMA